MFELVLVDTRSGARRRVQLAAAPATLGSAIDCEVVLPAAEVAPHQCRLEPTARGWVVIHGASAGAGEPSSGGSKPTLLNHQAVERADLKFGDVLRLGPFQLTVITDLPAPPEAASVRAPAAMPVTAVTSVNPARPVKPVKPALAPAIQPVRAEIPVDSAKLPSPRAARVRPTTPRRRPTGVNGVAIGAMTLVTLVILGLMMNGGGGDGATRLSTETQRAKLAQARELCTTCEFDAALRLVDEVSRDARGAEEAAVRDLQGTIRTRMARFQAGTSELERLQWSVATDAKGTALADIDRFVEQFSDLPHLRQRGEQLAASVRKRSAALAAAANAEFEANPLDTDSAHPENLLAYRQAMRAAASGRRSAERPVQAPAVPATSESLLTEARSLLEARDFRRALERLDAALPMATSPDQKAEIARQRERAARPLALAVRVAEMLKIKVPGGTHEIELAAGGRGRLVGSDGKHLQVEVAGARQEIDPRDLKVESLLELSGRLPLTPDEALSRAFVAIAGKDDRAFFAGIERGAAVEVLKASRDWALALHRGLDQVPPRGFLKVGDRWVTWAEQAEQELRAEVSAAVARIGAAKAGEAEQAEATIHELHGASPALVLAALQARRDELGKAFEAAPEQDKVALVHAKALALKEARTTALALIFDEGRYFYPYHPPECPPEQAVHYHAVQQEVDGLVDAVRAIWGREADEPDLRVPLSAAFTDTVRDLKVVRRLLGELGAAPDEGDQALAGAWCLPADVRHLTVRNFALDERERTRLDQDTKVWIHNLGVKPADAGTGAGATGGTTTGGPSNEELEQVHVTNRYRQMLGRRVLAWNDKLDRAARAHSRWMSQHGELTHYEDDDPKRREPEQRMRLEGYLSGAGENCMVGRSDAASAHNGWCHSSGHHRNLLYASHTEMGSGMAGSYWTQNFGGGSEYKGNLIH